MYSRAQSIEGNGFLSNLSFGSKLLVNTVSVQTCLNPRLIYSGNTTEWSPFRPVPYEGFTKLEDRDFLNDITSITD